MAQASSPGVELGVDAGISFGLDDPHTTSITVPIQAFRVGMFLGDKVELEPRVALSSAHSEGTTVTVYRFELGALFQPGGNPIGTGLYIRPFGGIVGGSVSTNACTDLGIDCSGSDSNGYAGGGVGIKIPFARRMATRLEANYAHVFGDASANEIGLTFGLSFFTK